MNYATMRSFIYSLALVLAIGLAGCQDLSVENKNAPDRDQVLSTPGDIESVAGKTYLDFWTATQWCYPTMAMSTMADAHSASWGNWGMRFTSSEPRPAWNNNPSYTYADAAADPWFNGYLAISNAVDVLQAIEDTPAEDFENNGVNTTRMKAFVNFTMGLMYGQLAMRYDRGFLADETTDLQGVASGAVELELKPYTEVAEFAKSKLDKAIQFAGQYGGSEPMITADDDWIFGLDVSSDRLIRIANSYKARIEADVARTPSERQSRDWQSILTWIDQGITETLAPIGDDGGAQEWDCMKFYGNSPGTWARTDYRTIGPADTSGGYEDWLNTPVQDRWPYVTKTPDRRISGPDPESDGKDFVYTGTGGGPFPASRGTYHFSDRTFVRYNDYRSSSAGGGAANGPMPVMLMTEMNLLKAEALLHTQGAAAADQVAELINKTRVDNGELPPATASDPVGSIDNPPNPIGSSADPNPVTLWSMLKYEFDVETMLTAGGLNYYTDRGWGDLVEGTFLQWPVPGKDLETMGVQIYTFGGVGGSCAAGSSSGCKKGGKSAARAVSLGLDHPRQGRRGWTPTQPK